MAFNGTMGGARPGSQMGAGGARPGSGMRSSYGGGQVQAGSGDSLNQNVQVANRGAVTREGMKGVASRAGVGTSAGGGGRMSKDRSYWMGIMRPKVAEITAEIERLKGEEDKIHGSSEQIAQLQKRQKDLVDQLTGMKSTLADLNHGLEHINEDPEQIQSQAHGLKQDNIQQRQLVDKLFLSAKEEQQQCHRQEQVLIEESRRIEEAIQQGVDSRKISEYVAARDQSYRVADKVLQDQEEIRSLTAKQDLMMSQLSVDSDRKKAANLVLARLRKRQEKETMSKECSVSVEEERENLINQAKTAKNDIDVLERQINEAKDMLQDSRNKLSQVTDDLQEYSGDNAQRYQDLQQKDRDLQQYVDTLPHKEKEETEKVKQVEENIAVVLEHISRKQQIAAQMPAENAPQVLAHLTQDLNDNKQHLENAQVTQQRLIKELEERREELKKVEFLDSKISTELQSTEQRMKDQQEDIKRYDDLDALRQSIDARKKGLLSSKSYLLKQRDASKQHVHLLSTEYETRKKELSNNEVHTALTAQEHKLRLIWQSGFSLEEFVRLKEKETQYTHVKADVLRVSEECNTILKDPKRFDTTMTGGVAGPTFV